MTYHVYVTVSGEDCIARFDMDRDTGALDRRADVSLSGAPGPIASDDTRHLLHVARRGAHLLTSLRRDPATGDLVEIGTVPTASDPCYLGLDREGRFLLAAYYLTKKITVHRVGEDGAAVDPPVVFRETGIGAHCFQTDPSNRFAFVPHIAREDAPNAIFQFRFDAATGAVTPNDPATVPQPDWTGPRHSCFHPSLDRVYVSNEQGSSVSMYALDTVLGVLDPLQTVPTLPAGWTGANKCSQIRITPCGRYLYAPNRGHDSIAGFAVDPETGLLSVRGHAAAEKVPRAFEIDPTGRFLLSAGHESGRLAVYRIDGATGALEPIGLYPLGNLPMWVTILPAG